MIVEFKAKNNGRTRTHQHLFMLDEEVIAVTEGSASLKMAVSKVPLEDWTAILEKSWGAIEEAHFRYPLTGQEAIYTS